MFPGVSKWKPAGSGQRGFWVAMLAGVGDGALQEVSGWLP